MTDVRTGLEIVTIETPSLGDRSYLAIADGWAIAIDPQRDVDRVERLLADSGLRLGAVLETHLHNDYVTGGRALALRQRATYVLPSRAAAQLRGATGRRRGRAARRAAARHGDVLARPQRRPCRLRDPRGRRTQRGRVHRRVAPARRHGPHGPPRRGSGRVARPAAVPLGPPARDAAAGRHRDLSDARLRVVLLGRQGDRRRGAARRPAAHQRGVPPRRGHVRRAAPREPAAVPPLLRVHGPSECLVPDARQPRPLPELALDELPVDGPATPRA